MRIKLDENIPADLVSSLSAVDEVDTAHSEGLTGAADSTLWEAAQKGARFLITQDLDFGDLRQFMPGSHAGILLVRLKNPSRGALTLRIVEICKSDDFQSWGGCVVVATDSKIRIRRP